MAAIKSLSEIPTIAQLYQSSDLTPVSSSVNARYPASASINGRVGLIRADITKLGVDAIVNAANSSLLGGGGVDGAIHRAAGPELLDECRTLGGCRPGQAKITKGYDLPAKHVVHTVGPIYDDPAISEETLRSCYNESMRVAVGSGVKTMAFSAISTGVYGYPSHLAARVACDTVRRFLDTSEGSTLERVVFVTFEPKDVAAYNSSVP